MKAPKIFNNIPIRAFLIIPFVLQIIITVGLIGFLSFQAGHRAVNTLVDQLVGETNTRVVEELERFLETPHKINSINAKSLESDLLNLNNKISMEKHLINQLQHFEVSGIGIATEQDEYREILHLPDKNIIIGTSGIETNHELREWYIDENGQRAAEYKKQPGYYPTKRPWYQAAVKEGKPAWSKIYTMKTLKELIITGSRPIYDKQGVLLGVTATGLKLTHIGKFLADLNIGKSGLRRKGTLLRLWNWFAPILIGSV